jgi:hypothetical protein
VELAFYFHAPSFPDPKPVAIGKDLGVTATCILLPFILLSLEYCVKDKFYEANIEPKDLKNNELLLSIMLYVGILIMQLSFTVIHWNMIAFFWQKALHQIATNLSLIVQAP